MTLLMVTSYLAQRTDWIEGAIILGIVVLSALGSLGKWIVQQLAASRERSAARRAGMPLEPRPPVILRERDMYRPDDSDDSALPPVAAPMPPVIRPARRPGQTPPPVMERVLEVLLEKASGTELERRVRKMMPQSPPPPPSPPPSETRVRKLSPQRAPQAKKPTRSMTIAEREAKRDRTRQTEVELETQRLVEREQRFSDDTDQRLGRVDTHIPAAEVQDSASMDAFDLAITLDDPDALRRAFVLSEILAPPLALRREEI